MKYVYLLAAVACVYLFLTHKAPVAPVVAEITQKEVVPLTGQQNAPQAVPGAPAAPAASGNSLKRPIDRTREVLGQVKQRNGNGEF
jgi:hypothetical protein